jgi:hypothetical protein
MIGEEKGNVNTKIAALTVIAGIATGSPSFGHLQRKAYRQAGKK